MVKRIAIITGRRAKKIIESIVSRVKPSSGLVIDVIDVPIDIAALIPKSILIEVVKKVEKQYDVIIVPGTLEYSLDEIKEAVRIPIVRGPRDVWDLERLAELDEYSLDEIIGSGEFSPRSLLTRWIERLAENHRSKECVDICGVRVPIRPPPVVVVAELYLRGEKSVDEVSRIINDYIQRGADLVVVGSAGGIADRDFILRVLEKSRDSGITLGLDSGDSQLVSEASKGGLICFYMSVGLHNLEVLGKLSGEEWVVVIPMDKNHRVPSSPDERISLLKKVVEEAERLGFSKIVVDPILDAPGSGSLPASLVSYYLASSVFINKPLIAGVANVYELIDADSHGQLAVLAQILAESGVSLILVTEESWKTRMSISEASIAATMASISLMRSSPPKDLGVDLLYVKEKKPKLQTIPRVEVERVVDASIVSKWVRFRYDPLGSFRISLDGDEIVVYYTGRRGVLKIRGLSAQDVYKSIKYLELASDPLHYAYLGYELSRAEIALRLKKSYIEEEELLDPPWTKIRYSARYGKMIGKNQ